MQPGEIIKRTADKLTDEALRIDLEQSDAIRKRFEQEQLALSEFLDSLPAQTVAQQIGFELTRDERINQGEGLVLHRRIATVSFRASESVAILARASENPIYFVEGTSYVTCTVVVGTHDLERDEDVSRPTASYDMAVIVERHGVVDDGDGDEESEVIVVWVERSTLEYPVVDIERYFNGYDIQYVTYPPDEWANAMGGVREIHRQIVEGELVQCESDFESVSSFVNEY